MATQILPILRDTSLHLDTKSAGFASPSFDRTSNPLNQPMASNLQPKTVIEVDSSNNDNTSSIRKPKHPQYVTHRARLDSYVGWPGKYVPKTPEELSSAGFFYIGSADRVTCFQCGITLRDWEVEHDPIIEHRRYATTCQYIHQVVEEARTQTCAQEGTSSESSFPVNTVSDRIEKINLNGDEKLSSLSSVQSGCSEPNEVEEAFSNTKDSNAGVCASISDVTHSDINEASAASSHVHPVSSVESINTSETKPPRKLSKKMAFLQAENNRLKEESVCRMCKHKQASILFLPCGHLVTCPDCAETVVDCIKCGKNILGTVRTYRA